MEIVPPHRLRSSRPHFSHLLYCIGAMIRPECVALGRPFRRFATTWCEKCGLALEFPMTFTPHHRNYLLEKPSIGPVD